jgi:hypothetical protein
MKAEHLKVLIRRLEQKAEAQRLKYESTRAALAEMKAKLSQLTRKDTRP